MGQKVDVQADGADTARGASGDGLSDDLGDDLGLTWRDRIYAWRDRMCANGRFQHWVATFPLTRRTAQKHARSAFDLCAGFVYSQILVACIELKLLEALFERPHTAAELAARCRVPLPGMERLLAAAAALDLVSRRARGRWGLGTTGAGIAGSPGVAEMVRHHAHFYADLRDPVALLRGQVRDSQLSAYWAYATSDAPSGLEDSKISDYSALMASSQAMISRDVIEAYPLSQHRRLLDVGGGKGAFIAAVAEAEPKLELSVFDLPAVAVLAKATLAARGLDSRVEVHGGDFFRSALPRGADVMSLVRILHDHDDDDAMELLRNIHTALPAGGTLLVAEPMAATAGGEVMGDAYFGLYLLAMGSGRPRTPEEVRGMLRTAGFKSSRILRTARPMLVRVVVAVA
jgi:demethylspheroidene O-methyltransferase